MIILNNKILILGGCNYKLAECYNDIWELDLDNEIYSKIYDEEDN